MKSRMWRRSIASVLAASAVLGLAACTPKESDVDQLTSTEADARYLALAEEIADVLNAAYPEINLSRPDGGHRILQESRKGGCIIRVAEYLALENLPAVAGGWEPVIDAISPALAAANFPAADREDSPEEDRVGIGSADQQGGRVQIWVEQSTKPHARTRVVVSAVVSDKDCKRGAHG